MWKRGARWTEAAPVDCGSKRREVKKREAVRRRWREHTPVVEVGFPD